MDVEKLLNTTHGIIVIFCDYKNNHLSAGIIVQATVNLNIVTLNFPNSINSIMSNVQLRQFLVSVLLFVYRVYGKICSGVSLSLYILKIKLDIIFLHCLRIFRFI